MAERFSFYQAATVEGEEDPNVMSSLSPYLKKTVSVITTEGLFFVGVLESYDHSINLLLRSCSERYIEPNALGETRRDAGTMIIRGELVATVGLYDENIDKSIDWANVKGSPFGSTKHSF